AQHYIRKLVADLIERLFHRAEAAGARVAFSAIDQKRQALAYIALVFNDCDLDYSPLASLRTVGLSVRFLWHIFFPLPDSLRRSRPPVTAYLCSTASFLDGRYSVRPPLRRPATAPASSWLAIGMVNARAVPWPSDEIISRLPPSPSVRSRMLARPWPLLCCRTSKPPPLSVTRRNSASVPARNSMSA